MSVFPPRTTRLGLVGLLVLIALAAAGVMPSGPAAHGATPPIIRVVVVIQGQESTRHCVGLTPGASTGLDALRTTRVDLNFQAGPLGAAVCRIHDQGCTHPAEPCFCQCQGGKCAYWAYFYQNDQGAWQYSSVGASSRKLADRAVEGWLWSESSDATPSAALPRVTFDEVCGAAAQAEQNVRGASSLGNLSTLLGYGVLAVLVVGLAGLALRRRRVADQ